MVGGEGTERPDVVLGDKSICRFVRPLARENRKIPHPESGDGFEGETLLQVVGLVEAAILDAGADLQRMEEPFDPPAQFVPVQWAGCAAEAGGNDRSAGYRQSASEILVRAGCGPESTSAALCMSVLMADRRKLASSGIWGAAWPTAFRALSPPLLVLRSAIQRRTFSRCQSARRRRRGRRPSAPAWSGRSTPWQGAALRLPDGGGSAGTCCRRLDCA